MKVYDVSLNLHNGMIVYPNNSPFGQKTVRPLSPGGTNLSEITMGAHTGTHVDSMRHVKNGAKAGWQIEKLIGKCSVLDLSSLKFGSGIAAEDLDGKKFSRGETVLLKTKNSARGFAKFLPDYVYLAESGANLLAKKGAKAVGIDSVAVQKYHAGNQTVHSRLLLSGIPVIEGLDLKGVPAGKYEFFCLPLKIECDGLPARAILIKR